MQQCIELTDTKFPSAFFSCLRILSFFLACFVSVKVHKTVFEIFTSVLKLELND